MTEHEVDILNEQVAAQQRVLAEAEAPDAIDAPDRIRRPLPRAELEARLQKAIACDSCGKSRVVLNLADYRRPFRAERIRPETHCTCAPRFTADGGRIAAGPAWEFITDPCPDGKCYDGVHVELYDGYPEQSVCEACAGLGRVPIPRLGQERVS